MDFDLQPYLENDLLVLRPIRKEDFEDLFKVASDPLIWEQHSSKDRFKKKVFEAFFKEALDSGTAFIIIGKDSGEIIGSTRFQVLKGMEDAIEIGWTFLNRKYWGGGFNTSLKKLMMGYAFQFVENIIFFINEHNIRSQKAVEKLGASRINDLVDQLPDDKKKSTFVYSISKSTFEGKARGSRLD
jgi:N-acetyltransferase